MKKKIVMGLAILAILFAVGCSKQSEESQGSDEVTVSVMLKSFNGDFWKTVQLGAEEAGADFGVNVIVEGCDTETDFDQQIRFIENAVTKGVDVIAISTLDTEAMVPAIEAAADEGIKIITFNSKLNSSVPLAHIATNNWAAGELAGKALGESMGGTGKYAVLGAVEGVKNNRDRSDGAVAYIEEHFPEMELITIQYTNNDLNRALAIATDIITANPDVKGFFANNETTTIGVGNVLLENDMVGDISFVGFDATASTVPFIEDEVVDSVVTQVPYNMGYLSVQYGIDALNGLDVESEIDTGVALVTKDNLNDTEIQKIINPLN